MGEISDGLQAVSRSLLGFLVFLAVLLAGFLFARWWVGPTMVSLALDEQRSSNPYFVLHLLHAAAPDNHFRTLGELLAEEEGRLAWRGEFTFMHSGLSHHAIEDVAIMEFAEGGAVVQLLTSSGYRELTARIQPLLLGTPVRPEPVARDAAVILWLLQLAEGVDAKVLEPVLGSARALDGRSLWSSALEGVAGAGPWNHVLMMAFPNAVALRDWLSDPRTATERAFLRRFHKGEVMLELRSF